MNRLLFSLFVLGSVGCGTQTASTIEAAPAADVAALVKGNNAFAFDLYRQLRDKPGNLFLSPYSISTALGMTSAGACSDTLTEMTTALHFPEQAKLHPAFTSLIEQVNGAGKKRGYQLSTANALWGQKDYDFQADFLKLTKDHYGAGLREVDFVKDTEVARNAINEWVERETQNKIKDLIKQGVLNVNTRLVLTNAIYFKGDWASQFKKADTREEPYFLSDGGKTKVPLMHQTGRFKYYQGDGFQALEMPYVGKELAMLVLLPRKADGLAALEKNLSAEGLAKTVAALREEKVVVTLPRFKTTAEFELNKTLESLGMKKAFLASAADFSGINGSKNLFISQVVHKAFVEVNEEGTEAAGSTGVVIKATSARPEPPVFRADRPFVFLIRDTRNGSLLFLGRLSDPTR